MAAKKKSRSAAKPAARKAPAGAVSTRTAARRDARAVTPQLQHEVEQFLYRQAALLDDKRWQDWIDLFTPDGVYWMPPEPGHTHWDGMPAIFAEDRNIMTVRMKRVLHPDAWSQVPIWGTNHVVGNVVIEAVSPDGSLTVRSRFHMLELRRDQVRHFAGQYTHQLKKAPQGWKIRLQRVDMTNAQAAYDYVLQVWV